MGPLVKGFKVNGRSVQKALKAAGFFPGKIDGEMGRQTREALKAFQKSKGLHADGLMGLRTMKALLPYLTPPDEASGSPKSSQAR